MKKAFSLILLLFACAGTAGADVITEWNTLMRQTFAFEGSTATPPTNSRTMGMMGAAMFDAVNSVNRNYSSYLGYFDPTTAGSSIDVNAAAAAAANTVMQSVYADYYGGGNSYAANFTSLYNTQLSGIADGEAKTRGIEVGIAAAQAMITARANDGWNATSTYSTQPFGTPGAWQPGTTAGAWGSSSGVFIKSEWGYVTPFTMSSGDQFRPTSIMGYQANDLASFVASQAYTDGFNQVKSLGVASGSTRTADQTAIAYFWVDGPGTASPPGHWNRIAQTVSASMGLSVEDNARLFALLNLAEADTGIATWDAKRAYDLWRPMIAINTASTDGNGDTLEDAAWSPLIPTPSFPAYTSGHSAFSMAAATILADFFGTDDIAFTSDTESPFLPLGYTRDYASFSEAAEEAGMSRIYGGIHWAWDNTDGAILGANVADNAYNTMFLPVPEPGSAIFILCAGFVIMLRRRSRFP
jgi:membrane-associated phospholipid phosphatase